MKTPDSPRLCFAALLLTPLALAAQPAPTTTTSKILYQESFDRSTNVNGWYSYGGGKNVTTRADVISFVGHEGTNAFVFTASADTYEGYWHGAICRNDLSTRPGVGPEAIDFIADLALIGSVNSTKLTVRLIQGSPDKPTWSCIHKPTLDRVYRTFIFNLGEGDAKGAFNPDKPVHLHGISFGNGNFGAAADVQVAVDNVRLVARIETSAGTQP